jgi:hypothetical protein
MPRLLIQNTRLVGLLAVLSAGLALTSGLALWYGSQDQLDVAGLAIGAFGAGLAIGRLMYGYSLRKEET